MYLVRVIPGSGEIPKHRNEQHAKNCGEIEKDETQHEIVRFGNLEAIGDLQKSDFLRVTVDRNQMRSKLEVRK